MLGRMAFRTWSTCFIQVTRHHQRLSSHVHWIELHVLCDASEKAFSAVVYLPSASSSMSLMLDFCYQTHFAPIKPALSIARLEFQGAVVAVGLWYSLKDELTVSLGIVCLCIDSNTVLQYIDKTRLFKVFLSNRISEIL